MKAYRYLQYSTQVWITSLVVSPALILFLLMFKEGDFEFYKDLGEAIGFTVLAIIYGGMFSFPNWLLLTGGVALVDRLDLSEKAKRLLIQLWAAALTVGLFSIFFGNDNWLTGDGGDLVLVYLLTISFGVWNYSFALEEET